MRKLLLLMCALLTSVSGAWAQSYFATAPTQVTSITSGKYYVINGIDQSTSNKHYLFDNGQKVTSNNPQALPTDWTAGKFIWKIVGNSTDGYTLQNLQTGKYMSLGNSNGSAISTSSTSQTNAIDFGDGNYATIHNNDNGQAIDVGWSGNNPTTWAGNATPDGSRRLEIFEVNVVEIVDDACYTLDFVSFDETKTWGLKAGTTEQAPVANGTGDVFVAHSYTNQSGERRWIFVNNSDGTYLAYHGQANTAFDISNAINEWNISILTSGTYVDASANLAGKLSITNDKRNTTTSSQGCYLVKESANAYDNASAPIYKYQSNNYYTAAIRFTATGATASATASLAIAKFEALYEVKSYLPYAAKISALFADPSSIEANINAAATAEAAATIATNFMKSPEGKKFYAVASTATGQYMNIGPSAVSATSTTLTPEGVMEIEYAGNGKYYLKGVRLEKYAGTPGNPTSTYSAKGDATAFYIGNYENATDNKVYFAKTKTNSTGEALHYNNTYTTYVTNWTYSAGASQWDITAVSDAEYTELCNNYCDVTYNAIMEASGTVVATATTIDATRGAALAMPSAIARDYCTVTFYSDAACTTAITTVPDAATATVYALVTYTPPFTLSASYETATWYYATLRGSKYIRANESAKDGSGRYTTNTTNEKTDVYKWAFVGTNPYDLTIMNRGAGSSKVLYAESTTVPTMKAGVTPASDSKARWIATPNTTGAFALRNESGATLYINDAGSAGNLGFWNSTNGTSDAGSNWVITEVPTVDVTYNLSVGGTTVNTIVVEDVPEYSEIAVPAGLTNGYTTFAYDFATSGTIGGENSTITVTATLKSGIVQPAELSNSKKYRLTCQRGSLSTYTTGGNTYLASPVKTSLGVTAKEFAIINYNNNLYLYSVDDQKFVTYQSDQIAPLADMPTATDAVSFSQTTNSVYEIRFDNSASKILNSSASYTYGIVINGWGASSNQWDDGCQYIIEEVGDFDPTQALNALNGPTAYSNIIAALKAVNWGLTSEGNHRKVGYYNFTENASADIYAYAGNEMAFLEMMEAQGYSAENLQVAQSLNSPGYAYALNTPATGKFYRIKGYSNNYMTYNTAGSNASMNGTASANNIVYYNDAQNLVFFGGGYGMYNTSIVAPAGSTLNAYTFSEGAQASHYYVRSNASGVGTYCYDNTANGSKVDRNGSPVTSGSYQTDWTLEEVTSLPVTISSVGYATLYAPVALTIPSGVTAYIATIDDKTEYLSLVEVENGVIPAETGVILAGAANTYYFDITTGGSDASNVLEGTAVAIARPADSYILATGSNGVGLYKDGADVIPGFKAYLPAGYSNARGFLGFSFGEVTAITAIEAALNSGKAVYDLNGRRVENPSNGVYIVNGKKVIINKK